MRWSSLITHRYFSRQRLQRGQRTTRCLVTKTRSFQGLVFFGEEMGRTFVPAACPCPVPAEQLRTPPGLLCPFPWSLPLWLIGEQGDVLTADPDFGV